MNQSIDCQLLSKGVTKTSDCKSIIPNIPSDSYKFLEQDNDNIPKIQKITSIDSSEDNISKIKDILSDNNKQDNNDSKSNEINLVNNSDSKSMHFQYETKAFDTETRVIYDVHQKPNNKIIKPIIKRSQDQTQAHTYKSHNTERSSLTLIEPKSQISDPRKDSKVHQRDSQIKEEYSVSERLINLKNDQIYDCNDSNDQKDLKNIQPLILKQKNKKIYTQEMNGTLQLQQKNENQLIKMCRIFGIILLIIFGLLIISYVILREKQNKTNQYILVQFGQFCLFLIVLIIPIIICYLIQNQENYFIKNNQTLKFNYFKGVNLEYCFEINYQNYKLKIQNIIDCSNIKLKSNNFASKKDSINFQQLAVKENKQFDNFRFQMPNINLPIEKMISENYESNQQNIILQGFDGKKQSIQLSNEPEIYNEIQQFINKWKNVII